MATFTLTLVLEFEADGFEEAQCKAAEIRERATDVPFDDEEVTCVDQDLE
jgi:hypothetical protein